MFGAAVGGSAMVIALFCIGCGPSSGPADAAVDAGALDDAGGDGGAIDRSIGRMLRDYPDVVVSARAEATEGGARPCDDSAGGSCLDAPCEFAAGCVYVAEIRYESTPAEGTTAPPLTIRAQYFQLAARGEVAGHAPVMILNHGGRSVGAPTIAFALNATARGYAVLVSTYRGSGGADGAVEGCLGEADDVRILAEMVRESAPEEPLAMTGGSHGGCVTLQALQAGAPVDAAVALWPGTDGARRYRYNLSYAEPGSELTMARDRCAGVDTSCCRSVRTTYTFVTEELVDGTRMQLGPLPAWQTTDYTCNDPAFSGAAGVWDGQEELEQALCSRSPLARATTLDEMFPGPLLIVHGERDPYISFAESCEYARQAGGFALRRINDAGEWVAAGGGSPCDGLTVAGGMPGPQFDGDRHLVLIEPLGHGDTGRPDVVDACDGTEVASPDPNALVFAFLTAKLGL